MRAQSRGGCKASPANKKGGCEVDGASEPTCKAYPAIVLFTKNSLNYKGFLTFVIITISVIPLCLCAPNFAPPPLLCGSTFAPPYALRPQLCNPPFLCGGMFAPPVCFAPSTLHPPCSLRGYLCTPPETLTAAQQHSSTAQHNCVFPAKLPPQSYPRKVTATKLPPQSYPRKATPANLTPQS